MPVFRENLIPAGYFSKKFGYKGELILHLDRVAFGRIKNFSWLFADIQGTPVPFHVTEYEMRDDSSVLVALEGVDNAEKAGGLVGCRISLPSKHVATASGKDFHHHDIAGWEVIDCRLGLIGIVEELIPQSHQDLLKIRSADSDFLLPFEDGIVVDIDTEKKQIHTDVPEGLISLNE